MIGREQRGTPVVVHLADGAVAQFKILGSFEAWAGGRRLHVGGKQSVRALTVLLAEADRVVPLSRLIAATWDGEAPATAGHQIRKIVADLRRRLPDGAQLIVTDGPGYRLEASRADVDLARFDALLAAAQRARISSPRDASRVYAEALHLWSPLLAGEGGDVIEALSQLVHSRWLRAAEDCMELRLALEPAAEVVSSLVDLAQREPLVEGLRGQLIRALYLAGRQAEALREYDSVRRLLAEELGVDPSPGLRAIYAAVLANDEAAMRPSGVAESPEMPLEATLPVTALADQATQRHHLDDPFGPTTLPRRSGSVVGREHELAQVRALMNNEVDSTARIVVLHGLGGMGTSALAIHIAHEMAELFPDGQLYVDLRAHVTQPGETGLDSALEQLFHALGQSPEEIPTSLRAKIDRWRMLTARRSMLLVVDDVPNGAALEPLILSGPTSLTLATAHSRLPEVSGSHGIRVGPLTPEACLELLRRSINPQRIERESEAAVTLAHLTGGFPLALQLITTHLRRREHESLETLCDRLAEEGSSLDDLSVGGRSLENTFHLAIEELDAEHLRALSVLAHFPWVGIPVPRGAAAAWLDLPPGRAAAVLGDLEDSHLLDARDGAAYDMHGHLRTFVRRQTEPLSDAVVAARGSALLRYLGAGASRAAGVLAPGRRTLGSAPDLSGVPLSRVITPAQARRWFSDHHPLLRAVILGAESPEDPIVIAHLARDYAVHLLEAGLVSTGQEVGEIAVRVARAARDRELERLSLSNLALFQWRGGELDAAIEALRAAEKLAEAIKDRQGQAAVLARLGAFRIDTGLLAEGCADLERALETLLAGQDRERASALNSLSSGYLRRGDLHRAASAAAESLNLDDSAFNAGLSKLHLASVAEARGDLSEARDLLDGTRAAYELTAGSDRLALVDAHVAWTAARQQDGPGMVAAMAAAESAIEAVPAVRRAQLENLLALADAAGGNLTAARARHARALQHATSGNQPFEAAMALRGLAEATAALGDADIGSDFAARANEECQRIGGSPVWRFGPD